MTSKVKLIRYTIIILIQVVFLSILFAFDTQIDKASLMSEMPAGMDYNQVDEAPIRAPGDYGGPILRWTKGIFALRNKDLNDDNGTVPQDATRLPLITGNANSAIPSFNGFITQSGVQPGNISFGSSSPSTTFQGVAWSNNSSMLDLTSNQTYSMWIATTDKDIDGGFAFVIQNDKTKDRQGIQALSTIDNFDGGYSLAAPETMGVWANDLGLFSHGSEAIQNSWALEIDNTVDNSGGANHSFDMGLDSDKMHISTGFPGQAKSYTALGMNAYKLNHSDPDYHVYGGEGPGYYWHHLTIIYNPNKDGKTADITYKFNDKLEDGSKNKNTGTETLTNPIESTETKTINLQNTFNLASGQTKVRWGLVGYGDKGKTIVSLESITSFVDADITTQTIDKTQNRTLDSDNKYVNAGDEMDLRFDLKYNSGKENWDKIYGVMDMPKNLSFTGGTINYADGTTESISASEISDGSVKHVLSKALGPDNKSATVDIYANAISSVPQETPVSGTHATFRGDTYAGDVTTQDFIIRNPKLNRKLNISSPTPSTINIMKTADATIEGSLSYDDSTDFDDYGADVYVNINGTDQKPVNFAPDSTGKKITFGEVLSGESLNEGKNTVTIYAKDSYGMTSDKLIFTINVSDKYANLVTDSKYSFGAINSAYIGTVKRSGDWNVKVNTENSPWELTASASKLTGTNGDNFPGSIIYKDGNSVQSMQDQNVRIGQSIEPQTGTVDITKDYWKNDENGILLQADNGSKTSNNYTGVITWTLTDAPESN
ncbi:hypothetical protein [Companilactobacillus insicii]|uniref:hypothetical protein n=1 Tax=Companilactobacillus insicii TaxID=1732567 RepID=UPI000F77F464|nr:hypothetical protein [Companilactobacillus insicii]